MKWLKKHYLSLFALSFFVLGLTDPVFHLSFIDFHVFYSAGIKAWMHHSVFDVQGHYQFKCSPFAAFLFGLLFHWFSFDFISHAFLALGVFFWSFIIYQWIGWIRAFQGKNVVSTDLFYFIIFFLIPLRHEFEQGQINWIPISLMWLTIKSLDFAHEKQSRSLSVRKFIFSSLFFFLGYSV